MHGHLLAVVAALMLLLAAPVGAADDIEKLDSAKVPRVKAPEKIAGDQKPLRVRVLVLEFNPLIPGALYAPDQPDAKPKGLREVAGWNDPLPLAAGYMQDLCDASGGLVQLEIAEWLVVRRFQKKVDGFVYTPETYMASLKQGTRKAEAWRKPDGIDYPHMINEFNLIPRVESGEIDEVWMMGLPYFGYWESAMAGKDAFYVNGGVYDKVPCKRRFVIMGFNAERGVAEMLEDQCHRSESTLSRIHGGWKVDQLTTNWARFAANEHQSGTAAVGTAHYPPNGERDYDYANERTVESTADDWLHYPNLTGRKRTFNREEWAGPHKNRAGQPDYHRNYLRWWFSHLPKAPGVSGKPESDAAAASEKAPDAKTDAGTVAQTAPIPDGRLKNWWEYLYNFNAYDKHGQPLPGARPPQDPQAAKDGYRRPA
ncbi:MAG: hypothetical protein AB1716_14125 [Planctomycetota bacterium]